MFRRRIHDPYIQIHISADMLFCRAGSLITYRQAAPCAIYVINRCNRSFQEQRRIEISSVINIEGIHIFESIYTTH